MLLKDVMEQNEGLKQISMANTNLNLEGEHYYFLIIDLAILTKNLNKWKSIREVDVSYNNLDIRSVKLISILMKNNHNITRFEMAPLLDVDLTEEDDNRLEKYFNDLDNWCYRNFVSITSQIPSQDKSQILAPTAASTPRGSNESQMNDSPSSILIQRRYSAELLNLQNMITQTIETLDTYDNIQSRSTITENDSNILQVRHLFLQ